MITRRAILQAAMGVATVPSEPNPARAIFEHVNRLRAAREVPALEWSTELARCAEEQSARKALLRFPGHDDPERGGVDARLTRAGLHWMRCAENLFQMRGYEDIAAFAVVFWWYSLGHQQNMLNSEFTQTGVGTCRAAEGTWFATQIFARPGAQ